MGVVEPLNPDELTPQQKRYALRTVSLLNDNRNGDLKGRTCADGSKQRPYVTKEDSSSPTVSTEALTTTFVIDAYERRVVDTADVTGSYLNNKMDQFLVMKIEGDMVDFMVQAEPKKYAPHVHIEHGRKVLYIQIPRALYGCI